MFQKPLPSIEALERAVGRLLSSVLEQGGGTKRPSPIVFHAVCRAIANKTLRDATEATRKRLTSEIAAPATVAAASAHLQHIDRDLFTPDPDAPDYVGTYSPAPTYETGKGVGQKRRKG